MDRRSFTGGYEVANGVARLDICLLEFSMDNIDGLFRNPKGRTGIAERGQLLRWGPNHTTDPIITRFEFS